MATPGKKKVSKAEQRARAYEWAKNKELEKEIRNDKVTNPVAYQSCDRHDCSNGASKLKTPKSSTKTKTTPSQKKSRNVEDAYHDNIDLKFSPLNNNRHECSNAARYTGSKGTPQKKKGHVVRGMPLNGTPITHESKQQQKARAKEWADQRLGAKGDNFRSTVLNGGGTPYHRGSNKVVDTIPTLYGDSGFESDSDTSFEDKSIGSPLVPPIRRKLTSKQAAAATGTNSTLYHSPHTANVQMAEADQMAQAQKLHNGMRQRNAGTVQMSNLSALKCTDRVQLRSLTPKKRRKLSVPRRKSEVIAVSGNDDFSPRQKKSVAKRSREADNMLSLDDSFDKTLCRPKLHSSSDQVVPMGLWCSMVAMVVFIISLMKGSLIEILNGLTGLEAKLSHKSKPNDCATIAQSNAVDNENDQRQSFHNAYGTDTF